MYYDTFTVKAYIKIGRFIQAKFFSHIITVAKIGFISPGYKNIEAMEKVELKIYIEPFVLHAHRYKVVKSFYQHEWTKASFCLLNYVRDFSALPRSNGRR